MCSWWRRAAAGACHEGTSTTGVSCVWGAHVQGVSSRYGALVCLRGSHRQCSSGWFVQCLDRIRTGTFTDGDLSVLNATSQGVSDEMWSSRTQLRALVKDVNAVNRTRLEALSGPSALYACHDKVYVTHVLRRETATKALQDVAPASVAVKERAIVILTRAVDGVPSGTQGVVTKCGRDYVACLFDSRVVVVSYVQFDVVDNVNTLLASRSAIPLLLAWAITIHRAQGTSLNSLAIDFATLSWRAPGLVYSSISRCRLFENLYVRGLRREHIRVCPEALEFCSLSAHE